MNCKDCYHYEICPVWDDYNDIPYCDGYSDFCNNYDHFKDKSRIVELPCKVGQTVYIVDNYLPKTFLGIAEAIFRGFEINSEGRNCYFVKYKSGSEQSFGDNDIGLSIFLNRQAAEAKLKKLEK